MRNLALLAAAAVLSLGAAEGLLRALRPANPHFLVHPPHLRQVLRPDPGVLPGIQGQSLFKTNALGLRGEEWTPESDLSILVMGGSSAECLMLDQAETWPRLVEQELQRATGLRVWIGNAGKSGKSSREYLLQIDKLPRQLPGLRAVLLLTSVNDFMLRLRQGKAYDASFLQRAGSIRTQVRLAFYRVPDAFWYSIFDPDRPRYKNTALWRILRDTRLAFESRRARRGPGVIMTSDDSGHALIAARRKRADARPLLDALPDLNPALSEYAGNLNRIADLASGHGVELVLLTQPAMWRPDLPPELDRLLWLGHDEGGSYYSARALAEGLQRYNRIVLDVCRRRGLVCVDLASLMPQDGSMYYDGVHFNEAGALRVAAMVAPRVRQRLLCPAGCDQVKEPA